MITGNTKVDSYIQEIVRVVSELNAKADVSPGLITKVVSQGEYGPTITLMRFYRSSARVMVLHPKSVPAEHKKVIGEHITGLNTQLEDGWAYGIGDKDNGLVFEASYDLRKRNAADDAGLLGFCTFVFVTVPKRLDQTASLIEELSPDLETEIVRRVRYIQPEASLK